MKSSEIVRRFLLSMRRRVGSGALLSSSPELAAWGEALCSAGLELPDDQIEEMVLDGDRILREN